MDIDLVNSIREKYIALEPFLNERTKRLWAAAETKAIGRGGKAVVSTATKLSRTTIYRGLCELEHAGKDEAVRRIRQTGGGRKALITQEPELMNTLKGLVEDTTRGDPESPLLWTCKSTRQLAEALAGYGYRVGRQKVSEMLSELGYSLQSNRKTQEGREHPDRDKQFRYLTRRVKWFQRHGHPVISVDTKKKELIGEFANKGREWRAKGQPRHTQAHDFGTDRVSPYGVYESDGQ